MKSSISQKEILTKCILPWVVDTLVYTLLFYKSIVIPLSQKRKKLMFNKQNWIGRPGSFCTYTQQPSSTQGHPARWRAPPNPPTSMQTQEAKGRERYKISGGNFSLSSQRHFLGDSILLATLTNHTPPFLPTTVIYLLVEGSKELNTDSQRDIL